MHTTLFANLLRCAGRNASFGVNRGMLFHSTRTYQNLDVDGNRVFAGNGSDLGLATGALATRESLREYAPQRSYPYSREATLAGRPAETPRLGGVAFGAREEKAWHNSGASAWTLLEIAAHALACAQAMGVALRLEEMPSDHPIALALHPGRRAALMTPHGEPAGWVGEVHPAALRAFDVPVHTLGFELNLAVVMEAARAGEATRKRVVAPLRFPPVSRDFAFLLSEKVEAGGLSEVVREALTGSSEPGVRSLSQVPARLVEVKVFDVYRGKGVPSGFKSVAFNVTVEPLERTLTDKDIQWLQGRVVECVVGRLEGELRGG
jgi:phenylalanyl-tRNA synthetase beta chain